jgi:hypothetical protein
MQVPGPPGVLPEAQQTSPSSQGASVPVVHSQPALVQAAGRSPQTAEPAQ